MWQKEIGFWPGISPQQESGSIKMHLPFPTPTVHVEEGWRDGHSQIVGSAFRLTLAVTTDKFTFLSQELPLMACLSCPEKLQSSSVTSVIL